MAEGGLVWAGIVTLNVLVLFVVHVIRKRRELTFGDALVAALVSDVIVHAFAVRNPEAVAWAVISFPVVGVISLGMSLLARWAWQHWRR